MDVGAQSRVVGEIPAVMVGIFVDYDLVAVPEPVRAQGQVKGGNAESEAAKPETVGPASCNAPDVAAAEAAGEAAMFPGMVEMEARIIAPVIMADPFTVVMDVRSLWVPGFVTAGRSGWRAVRSGRAVFWNVSATDGVVAGLMVIVLR